MSTIFNYLVKEYVQIVSIFAGCYCYIYVVARYHARAIYTVELSLRQQDYSHTRYGQTLAITVGLFICLWMPFQVLSQLHVMKMK